MSKTDRSVDLDAMALEECFDYVRSLHPDWNGEEVGAYVYRNRKVDPEELAELFKRLGGTIEELVGKPN